MASCYGLSSGLGATGAVFTLHAFGALAAGQATASGASALSTMRTINASAFS